MTSACVNLAGVSEVIDTVFHDEHTEEINNLHEEDCDIGDECVSSGSGMKSSDGEYQST